MRHTGTIKSVRPDLHAAWITRDDAGGDIYVNESRCRDVFEHLAKGDRVSFETEESRARPGTACAFNVTII